MCFATFRLRLWFALLYVLAALLLTLASAWFTRLVDAQTPAACTHWASPQGSGSTCTAQAPCQVGTWWSLAGPGKTLCLTSGTYTGESAMILPPAHLAGTAQAPITIRAEHDGQVLLDAQHARWAVYLEGSYFVVEGINATNGYEALYRVRGHHHTLRRVIGWNGTSGMADSNIFRVTGQHNRVEDCAAWGSDSRKLFDGAQDGNAETSGFRRCWGEWNDHPRGGPNPANTYQVGYNTSNQLFENILGTWDSTGDGGDAEGVLGVFHNAEGKANSMAGTRVLGALLYARPGSQFAPGWLVQAGGASDMVMRDVAAVLAPGFTGKLPFVFGTCPSSGVGACVNNTCTNCLAVHDGTASVNKEHSGWSLPQWHEGRGLAAATGGQSAFPLLPGLCYAYQDGVLTTTPLWPWKMNQRIKDARAQSGARATDVTQEIEAVLGPLPAECRTGAAPIPPDPVPPAGHVPLVCRGSLVSVPGEVQMTCVPQEGRR